VLTRLHEYASAESIPVAHVCEIGVYLPEYSNVAGWIERSVRTTLVECDPRTVAALEARWGHCAHVRIVGVAVADSPGTLTVHRAGASTFGANVPQSPATVNDGYRIEHGESFTAPAVTFDTLDDGTINVLVIDIEGAEWFVLRHLVSRPAIISVETHGKRYLNPFAREIAKWMQAEGYGPWYHDDSDTVFRRGWTQPVQDRSKPKSWFRRLKRRIRGY
jgi:FkbM family methyltransferase